MKNELLEKIVSNLVSSIGECRGLEVYAKGNNSFEQWMQVLVCSTLKEEGVEDVKVETTCGRASPDICFESNNEKYAIELKIIMTQGGGKQTDLRKVSEDIPKLSEYRQNHAIDHGIIMFAVFPCQGEEGFRKWANRTDAPDRRQAIAIINSLEQVGSAKFVFSNGVEGYIFSGILK